MSLDFPLILVLLVFGTGLIWLGDRLLLAPGRRRREAALRERHPRWQEEGSADARAYAEAAATLPREATVVEYSRSFFPVLAVVFVLRSFVAEPFQIPSSSMVPTLEVGDYILVNKFTYGIRLPVLRTKILDVSEPQRGDVMVFFPPHMNKTYYIKRVIGLPGDVVSYRNKRLYVNGETGSPGAAGGAARGALALSAQPGGLRWTATPAAGESAAPGARFHGDGQARSLLHDGRQS
jgi:signal peptidase I